jgi:hypothetical protein
MIERLARSEPDGSDWLSKAEAEKLRDHALGLRGDPANAAADPAGAWERAHGAEVPEEDTVASLRDAALQQVRRLILGALEERRKQIVEAERRLEVVGDATNPTEGE